MYETEKRLFGQALADAISQKLDEELRECKETAACSRAHSRYVKYTVKYGESPKARKISKRTIALIIAAALLLTGCAALVRDQIAGFFMTILETRNVIESPVDVSEYPKTIEEKRIPQVLPEGYELVDEVTTRGSLILTWIDAESNFLIYYQSTHEAGGMDIDNEHSDFGEIQIDEYDVLCVISEDGSRRYIWMDDYVYYISSSCELTKQELEDIVRNIK